METTSAQTGEAAGRAGPAPSVPLVSRKARVMSVLPDPDRVLLALSGPLGSGAASQMTCLTSAPEIFKRGEEVIVQIRALDDPATRWNGHDPGTLALASDDESDYEDLTSVDVASFRRSISRLTTGGFTRKEAVRILTALIAAGDL